MTYTLIIIYIIYNTYVYMCICVYTHTSVLLLIGERQFYKVQNTRLHLKTTRHNFFINFFFHFFFFIQICSGNFNARDKSLCLYRHLSFRYSIHIIAYAPRRYVVVVMAYILLYIIYTYSCSVVN